MGLFWFEGVPHRNVIIGRGGLLALNRVYTAAPDGLTITIANGTGAAFAQLSEQKGARFDLAKFGYLVTASASPWIWLVGLGSPAKTIQEAPQGKNEMAVGCGRPNRWTVRRRRIRVRDAQARLPCCARI